MKALSFISPVLAIMLYGMFTKIPFLHLREAFANRRLTTALLTVNFIAVPLFCLVVIAPVATAAAFPSRSVPCSAHALH